MKNNGSNPMSTQSLCDVSSAAGLAAIQNSVPLSSNNTYYLPGDFFDYMPCGNDAGDDLDFEQFQKLGFETNSTLSPKHPSVQDIIALARAVLEV